MSQGSNLQSFEVVGEALNQINQEKTSTRLEWHGYGMKEETNQKNLAVLPALENIVGLTPFSKPNSFEDAVNQIDDYLAFIVPDVDEDTFNFMALTAMCGKEFQRFVSDKSSVGKWMTMHCLPNCSKAIINLTGDKEADKEKVD